MRGEKRAQGAEDLTIIPFVVISNIFVIIYLIKERTGIIIS